jgi:hypothetical protein
MIPRSWADGLLLVAVVFNLAVSVFMTVAARRAQRLNAMLFLVVMMAWTMRGWHLDLSDAGAPKLIQRERRRWRTSR